MTFKSVAIETSAQLFALYEEGRCDVTTMEPPFLATRRARLKVPADHVILPEFFAKSDMGPIVRADDVMSAKAMKMVLRAPKITRESVSRPIWSSPNQWAADGAS